MYYGCMVFTDEKVTENELFEILAPYCEDVDIAGPENCEYVDEGYHCEDGYCEDGYYYNPNAKWNYFSVGGHWDEELETFTGEKINSDYAKNINFNFDKNIGYMLKNEYKTHLGKKIVENTPKENKMRIPFAFVDDNGEWHDKNSCFSTDSYKKVFNKYLSNAIKDNLYVTMIDYHY